MDHNKMHWSINLKDLSAYVPIKCFFKIMGYPFLGRRGRQKGTWEGVKNVVAVLNGCSHTDQGTTLNECSHTEYELTIQPVLVEVLEDNTEVQMNLSHGLRLQMITVSPTEDKVLALQLWSSPKEVLSHLFPNAAHGAPRVTVNVVHARIRGNIDVAVSVQFVSTVGILMPHFKVNLWPT